MEGNIALQPNNGVGQAQATHIGLVSMKSEAVANLCWVRSQLCGSDILVQLMPQQARLPQDLQDVSELGLDHVWSRGSGSKDARGLIANCKLECQHQKQ